MERDFLRKDGKAKETPPFSKPEGRICTSFSCAEQLSLSASCFRIRKKDKGTGKPIRLFLSLKLRGVDSTAPHSAAYLSLEGGSSNELETVIARFKDSGFTYTGSEETFNDMVRDHVKRNFPQWMYGLRDQIFKKYKDLNQRMNHPLPQISPSIWRKMVQKWTNPNWVEMSDKNKGNREKSELAATGGSAPLAKYDMKRRFHVKKDKNWVSSKARTLHDGMIQAEADKVSQGEEPNKFAIYQEVIGP
ncbi:unnamed protein product [Linum tenue]|uniref:Uncharacterized protein n=1 Tax=Linum tenue TaxID=586396 RepID=A0AAV0H984_9ROSI|nr:unnamed protein product [Linum tenue]